LCGGDVELAGKPKLTVDIDPPRPRDVIHVQAASNSFGLHQMRPDE
jgi:hypothetical protein